MLRVRKGKAPLIAAAVGAMLPTLGLAQAVTSNWTYTSPTAWTANFTDAINWDANGVPNGTQDFAAFPSAGIAGAATGNVVLNAAAITVGRLGFVATGTNSNGYTLSGTGTITLNTLDTSGTNNVGTIDVSRTGTAAEGVATISLGLVTADSTSLYKTGVGRLILSGSNAFGNGNVFEASAGTIQVNTASALNNLWMLSTNGAGVIELNNTGGLGTTWFALGSSSNPAAGALHAIGGTSTTNGIWLIVAPNSTVNVDAGSTLTQNSGGIVDASDPTLGGMVKIGLGQLNTLDAPLVGPLTMNAGTWIASGAVTGSSVTVNSGQLTANSINTPGALIINNLGTMSAGQVKIAQGATSHLAAGNSSAATLSIATGSTLDLTNNILSINYGANPTPAAAIRASLISGRNGGAWNGTTGIISTYAQIDPTHRAIGYNDTGTSVVVEFTRNGDATLDGTVNFNDLLKVAQFYGQTGKDWAHGDFNYDGTVNFNDLLIVAQNYNGTLPAPALLDSLSVTPTFLADWNTAIASVPEPGTMAMLAAGTLGLLGGRKRRR